MSHDVATKEHMVATLTCVDKNGHVIECFIDIRHVTSPNVASLKTALANLFISHNLSKSKETIIVID